MSSLQRKAATPLISPQSIGAEKERMVNMLMAVHNALTRIPSPSFRLAAFDSGPAIAVSCPWSFRTEDEQRESEREESAQDKRETHEVIVHYVSNHIIHEPATATDSDQDYR